MHLDGLRRACSQACLQPCPICCSHPAPQPPPASRRQARHLSRLLTLSAGRCKVAGRRCARERKKFSHQCCCRIACMRDREVRDSGAAPLKTKRVAPPFYFLGHFKCAAQDLAALGVRLDAAHEIAAYNLQQELDIQASAGGCGSSCHRSSHWPFPCCAHAEGRGRSASSWRQLSCRLRRRHIIRLTFPVLPLLFLA